MTKKIHELDAGQRQDLIEQIEIMLPSHTYCSMGPRTYMWSTPKAMWDLEIDFNRGRYTVKSGENKWVRFDNDMAWLEQVLRHFGAIE